MPFDKIWGVLKTTAFLGKSIPYGMIHRDSHRFEDEERQKFHQHLESLNPGNAQSKGWVNHLIWVNMYCDHNKVTLLPREREALEETYSVGRTTVHEAMAKEKALFGENGSAYQQGSLNSTLRTHRPPEWLMPDGHIDL